MVAAVTSTIGHLLQNPTGLWLYKKQTMLFMNSSNKSLSAGILQIFDVQQHGRAATLQR